MSIIYCETHDRRWDSDKMEECPLCAAVPELRTSEAPCRAVPVEPDDLMLIAARDWSQAKYGKAIGDDAARGCWKVMWGAAPIVRSTKGCTHPNCVCESGLQNCPGGAAVSATQERK